MLCPHCNEEHSPSTQYCPKTGRLLTSAMPTCPYCGNEIRPGIRFCANCGKPLPADIHRSAPALANLAPPGEAEKPASPSEAEITLPGQPNAASESAEPSAGSYPPIKDPKLAWASPPIGERAATASGGDRRSPRSITLALAALVILAALVGVGVILRQFLPRQSPGVVLQLSSTSPTIIVPSLPPTVSLPTSTSAAIAPTNAPSVSSPSATFVKTQPPVVVANPTITPTASLAPASTSMLVFFSTRDSRQALYRMNPDNPQDWTEVPAPTEYEIFAWPTFCGDRIAFEAEDRSMNLPPWIFLYDPKSGSVQPVTFAYSPPLRVVQPGCSPSGRYMAMKTLHDNRWYLSVLDLEDQTIIAERPTNEYSDVGYASWPLEDDFFVWMGVRASGYFDIIETRSFASGVQFPSQIIAQGKYPAISPDGSRLAFFCGNLLHLCIAERPTLNLLYQIPVSYFKKVNKENAPATAAWSSDGQWIYFTSSISGNWDIYRMKPDGSQMQNLTESWTSDELMPAVR
ncbi:MAG: zinc-ribbon domain-containing protein [Anaerolineales bacterium]|nr:zinc-ribbon domain-containing protein [Anaerolineales bacterium]